MKLTDIIVFAFIGTLAGIAVGEWYKANYAETEVQPPPEHCMCEETATVKEFREELQMLAEEHEAFAKMLRDPLQLYVQKPVPKPPEL